MKWLFRLSNYAIACLAMISVAGFTACSDDDPDRPDTDELLLEANHPSFIAGEGSVTFTVTLNGEVITSKAVITNQVTNTPIENATWTTSVKGSYNFKATYNGVGSNVVVVEVTDKTKPTDTFFRQILLTKFTQTTCGPCATAQSYFNELEPADAEHFLIVAAHQEDRLACAEGSILRMDLGIKNMYPTWSYNFATISTGVEGSGITLSSIKQQITATQNTYPALCGIKASSTTEGTTAKIQATVQFQKEGNYKIACILTENGIAKSQNGETLEVFDHVLRKGMTNMQGDAIEPTVTGEEERTFDFEVVIDQAWNVANCQFVVYVLREVREGKYVVNNGAECPVSGSVDYKYVTAE